jgi:hypothetical protein
VVLPVGGQQTRTVTQRNIWLHFTRVKELQQEVNMNVNSLSDRRVFLKRTIQGAGLAFAAPAILSSLSTRALQAQASGAGTGAVAGNPYGTNDGRGL